MFFEDIIRLLSSRPMVPGKTAECLRLWETLNAQQQKHIYDSIRSKLEAGKFVHYDPLQAILDNKPKPPKIIVITADEYYRRYRTQADQDGWHRKHLPDQQKTIYVKQM